MSSNRGSPSLARFAGRIFGGWEAREKIFRPVIINLLTGVLIFVAAWFANDLFYRYVAPESVSPDWPIYCVLEPNVNKTGGPVTADLFVLNLSSEKYSGSDLERLAKESSRKYSKQVSPVIEIAMKDYLRNRTLKIEEDAEFNREKGKARIKEVDSTRSEITLDEIRGGAILKLLITTNEKRFITARGDFESLPVKISYARSP